MKSSDKNITLMMDFIKNGQVLAVKELVKQDTIDIHYASDYFLYLAAFSKNRELEKYFIDLGLDPEITKGRLAIAHPQELEFLRQYKIEKEIIKVVKHLDETLSVKESLPNKQKIKI